MNDLRSELVRRLHLFADGRASIIFDRGAFRAYEPARAVYEALRGFLDGDEADSACARAGITTEAFLGAIGSILNPQTTSPEHETHACGCQDEQPGRALNRLVLNISNDCNLRCRYCYAQGGSYGGARRHMDSDTAIRTMLYAYSTFDSIKSIQFFGGEPLLNRSVIDEVGRWIGERAEAGAIKDPPRLTMVTNGTILDADVLSLMARYGIVSTVSLDGPREINDALRGEGTYEKAVRYVEAAVDAVGCVDFEATFTRLHLEMGYELPSILAFFRDTFGSREVHVPWASLSPDHPLAMDEESLVDAYTAGARFSVQSMAEGNPVILSFAQRVMQALAEQKPINVYCPAGIDTLAVGVDGSWYPCFMFIGRDEMRMFNPVTGEGDPEQSGRIGNMIRAANDWSASPCAECWIPGLCTGCLGADHAAAGSVLTKTGCEVRRAIAKEVIIGCTNLSVEELKEMVGGIRRHRMGRVVG